MRANRSGIRIVHRLTTLLAAPVIAGACASTGPAASTVTDSTEAASPSPTQRGPWPSTTRGRPARCQGISHDDDPDHHRRTAGGRPARRQSDCPRPHGSTSDDLDLPRLNQVEKIAKLPRPLTTEGAPEGDNPEIADIGYYAPSQDLVLYYGDVGYWNGIVRIGQFDSDQIDFVERQPDGFEVTIETA
jgi:hypothetical protein